MQSKLAGTRPASALRRRGTGVLAATVALALAGGIAAAPAAATTTDTEFDWATCLFTGDCYIVDDNYWEDDTEAPALVEPMLAANETLWHLASFTNVPVFSPTDSIRGLEGITMTGDEAFDFAFTGGNSGNPQNGHFVSGGGRRLTATLPDFGPDTTFRVEVDFASHDGAQARTIALEGNATPVELTSANNQDWLTISDTFAGGTEFSVWTQTSIRIRNIRVIMINGDDDGGTTDPGDGGELPPNIIGVWPENPTYSFDVSEAPSAGGFGAGPVSAIPGVVSNEADDALIPGLEWLTGGGNFRVHTHSNQQWIDPNGTGRNLTTNVELSGPIKVEIVARSNVTGGTALLPLSFGNQTVMLEVSGTTATITHEFLQGEGTLSINPWSWGANEATDPVGRLAIQSIRIFEGELGEAEVPDVVAPDLTDFDVTVALPNGDAAVSTPEQFPTVADEQVAWDNDFARSVITPGATQWLINRESRDLDASLGRAFQHEGLLWVPLAAASHALGGVEFLVSDDVETVGSAATVVVTAEANSMESRVYGIHVVDEAIGFDTVFVPLELISEQLFVGHLATDSVSNSLSAASDALVVTLGATIPGASISRGGINNQPAAWYGSENAMTIAANLIAAQRWDGGWPRGIGQSGGEGQPWVSPAIADWTQAQIDEMIASRNAGNPDAPNPADRDRAGVSYLGRGITTHETRFMLTMYEATGIERFRDAALAGLDAILGAQYQAGDVVVLGRAGQTLDSDSSIPPFVLEEDVIAIVDAGRGGWPYYITEREMHRGGVSFQDDAHLEAMNFMLDIANGEFPHLDAARTTAGRAAFVAALEVVLRLQVRSTAFEDGVERPTAWAHHFNPETGLPMWGREFEPPAIVGGEETRDMFRYLVDLDLDVVRGFGGDALVADLVAGIHAAAYWIDLVEITGFQFANHALIPNPAASGLWARFYSIDEFQPMFADRRTPRAIPADDPFGVWDMQLALAENPPAGVMRNVYRSTVDESVVDPTRFYIDGEAFTLNPEFGEFDIMRTYASQSFERRSGY
ncbi:MAG: pectate lyase, partial [Promicromonosporaceae bacterium]|nr:pectate lyase [Promicromonosporaceae bacterium]